MVPSQALEIYGYLPRNRADAKSAGSKRFFTGEPCGAGHLEPRKTSNGNCVICAQEAKTRYAKTERGRERQSVHSARYRLTPNGNAVRNHLKAERRASKKRATPKWADREAIKDFYRFCPASHHVDHIIPLSHDEVCGLHVMENLQYLPAHENMSKSNKIVPITLEACVCPLHLGAGA